MGRFTATVLGHGWTTTMLTSTIHKRCEGPTRGTWTVRPVRALIVALAMVVLGGSPALAGARWRVGPNPLAFGKVKTGTALQKQFKIKSHGTSTLTGTVSSTFGGAGAAYFKVVSGAGAFSLAPGAALMVTVQFQPMKQGPSGGAYLILTSNAGVSTKKERFTGGGAGPAPTPTATATPTAGPPVPTPTATSTPYVPPTGLNGDILLVGGLNGFNQASNTADLYNVIAGVFDCSGLGGVNTSTGACNNLMNDVRYQPSVAALQNGEVLVAGGRPNIGVSCYNTAELYNPATNSFISTGSMIDAHCGYAPAVLLQNGQVLIAGGTDNTTGATANADLYDPTTGTFGCGSLGGTNTTTGYCNNTMTQPRYLHTATLLQNGDVLITGGSSKDYGVNELATAELFNPTTGTFSCVGGVSSKPPVCNPSMTDSREFHTATLLVNGPNAGDVLVVGGMDARGVVLQTAELYDPSTGTFSCVGGVSAVPPLCNPSMTRARYLHTATLLATGPDAGDVLIAGGEDQSGTALNTAELYNSATGTFTATGNMTTGRALATARLITTGPYAGYVLIAGGINNAGTRLSSAELFNPSTNKFMATGGMTQARSSFSGAALP